MKKEDKTNVMRILDSAGIEYNCYSYEANSKLTGSDIARILGQDSECVFKTLVTWAPSKKFYVFVIPVDYELDLKKAASSVKEKSVSMLKQADLLSTTGYVHGGCSPIGMKKQFQTVFHKTAAEKEKIVFSAGRVGRQVELPLSKLESVIKFSISDIVRD